MSSKTIEIASIHRGPVRINTHRDENRVIEFKETNTPGIFLTMVDEDEAAVLLTIGRPCYWKPGVDDDAGTAVVSGEANEQRGESSTDAGAEGGKDENVGSDSGEGTPNIPLPCSFRHKGGGKWQVLGADGGVVVDGLTKEQAETRTIELNTPAE